MNIGNLRDAFIYKKLVLHENRIIGTILYGDITDLRKIMNAIEKKRDIGSIRNELQTWDLGSLS